MQYEWDETKRIANLARHKVDFADAVDFQWDTARETVDDRFNYGEETLGGSRFYRQKASCDGLYPSCPKNPSDKSAYGE